MDEVCPQGPARGFLLVKGNFFFLNKSDISHEIFQFIRVTEVCDLNTQTAPAAPKGSNFWCFTEPDGSGSEQMPNLKEMWVISIFHSFVCRSKKVP